jgi:hypothetical protein
MGYDTLDLDNLAGEWQDALDELEEAHDDDETDAVLDARADIEKYTELCGALGIDANPEALRHCSATLISDADFEDYARDLAEDIGAIQSDSGWPVDYIDWKRAADALRSDYTTIEWDGDSYLTNDL